MNDMKAKRSRRALARAISRPDPSDWAEDELMTLAEAIAVFWPQGPLTVHALKTEIENETLPAEEIAGKFYVTPGFIKEMRCHARQKALASISGAAQGGKQPGSSSTAAALRKARDVALTTVKEQKERLRDISRGNSARAFGSKTRLSLRSPKFSTST